MSTSTDKRHHEPLEPLTEEQKRKVLRAATLAKNGLSRYAMIYSRGKGLRIESLGQKDAETCT